MNVVKLKDFFYTKLSDAEMQEYGENVEQLPSKQSILFSANGFFYKLPIHKEDGANLNFLGLIQGHTPILTHMFIHLQSITLTSQICMYKYQKVHFDCLTIVEARKCLQDLVSQACGALTVLHQCGFYHCDVRLENICFDSNFAVKFIDMDRCHLVGTEATDYGPSCMYEIKGMDQDWRQLAVLILWVVLEGTPSNYHKQKFNLAPPSLSANPFFVDLWAGKVIILIVRLYRF